ncbi:50S ribosomal protein L3, partial [Candidatus Woesearchaeota archaeon]|nr:50S ribosomal protein L3 [Candidatus Woesearchaeota archaeon]
MPVTRVPRRGSMAFWPRKRAKSEVARVRSWANIKDAKLLGFSGYKAGMTHILMTDNNPNSLNKGKDIFCPVTVVECPPAKAFSLRFYKKTPNGLAVSSQIFAENVDKDLERKLKNPKGKKKLEDIKEFDDLTVVVHTQPKLTGIGKKKPEIFEIHIGGNKEKKLEYAKGILGKEIKIEDIFSEGDFTDIHAVTRAKGIQGPVKRFGVAIRQHKAEKTKRGPASLGAWCGQGKMMYRVAHAGQMGYWRRIEHSKQILRIGNKPDEINPKGGFKHYGNVKNGYVLFKGSVAGASKRLIRFNVATRAKKVA